MSTFRSVNQILYAHPFDMGGFPIRQPFPTNKVEQIDPFLLLHHANVSVEAGTNPLHAGVGPHPHRGFSPVTFIFKGGVHHRDSRGNSSIITAGGAQWINSGMGIIHSERPPINIQELGGSQEIIQLWVNTPAANKMDAPVYIPVTAEDAPILTGEDGGIELHIFSGEILGKKGPVPTPTEVNAATIYTQSSGKLFLPVPEGHNAVLYLLDGKMRIEGFGQVEGLHAVLFENNGEGIGIEAIEPTRALFLTGAPLNEPVVSYGPFVMNTESEIMEAMRDYRMGKMGVLIEE